MARVRDPGGRERSRSFSRRIDAETWSSGQEADKARGQYVDAKRGKIPLREWWQQQRPALSVEPSTLAKYDGVWRNHVEPVLGNYELASIRKSDVERMLTAVGKRSAWQANEALKFTRMLLNRAVDDGRLGANPAARIKTKRTKRVTPRILTPAEVAAIIANLPARWRAFVLLDAYSSLRWSELVAVKREDLDLEARTLRVDERCVEVEGRFEWGSPKTASSERTVDLPAAVVPALAAHMLRFPPLRSSDDKRLEGLLFYGERGGVVRRHVFRKLWRTACEAAGVGYVRPEWLRHSGASLGYAATKDMKAVAARLGHTSTRMVDTVYVGLYEEASRAVADAIDALVRASLGESG